jgi:hypothetical protein
MHLLRQAISGSCHLREGVLRAKTCQAFPTSIFPRKSHVCIGLWKVTAPKPLSLSLSTLLLTDASILIYETIVTAMCA